MVHTHLMLTVLSVLFSYASCTIAANHFRRLTTTMATKPHQCQRLIGVSGSRHKLNDVVVAGRPVTSAKQHIIYFGGDVQDYREKMVVANAEYLEWNVETTAELLSQRFPDGLIMVVKPKTMFLNTYSVYSNFVDTDSESSPTHRDDWGALPHLVKLYANVLDRLNPENNDDPKNTCDKNNCDTGVPISLIGFSKGCVVLNQFICELHMVDIDNDVKSFMNKVKSMYWLDGGHNGGSNTWITDRVLLKKLASLKLQLYTHVTPYQVKDPRRAWIGEEQALFVKELKDLDANINHFEHHFDKKPSIDNHFDVLKQF